MANDTQPNPETFWININPADLWNTRESADIFAPDDRIGVVRVDVINGKMTVTVEPAEGKE